MNVIALLIQGVDAAIDLAEAGIAALAKSKAEEEAHLAELHGRLDARRARISLRAEENRRIAASLPIE